ncbi:uncharacterized protein PAC_07934 [Phialocephala subalpina]|uniref:Uncharacterized protein n=1 Tax=Phialocephala subalpina TaxID=576137 RepID=A0A1L7WZ57_9HELO|nr:uncharacterized protein PAC_07934 [Phialocephala subalpina]
MPSKASVCATNGSSRVFVFTSLPFPLAPYSRAHTHCPIGSRTNTRFNPYKRQPKPSKLTIPIDFPTYDHTSHLISPSIANFNKDIDTALAHSRKRRRISRHDINFDPESAKPLKPSPTTPHFSYSLARFDGDPVTLIPSFRYTGEEESLEVHISKMVVVIKGFEKAFWQI